MKKMTYVNKRKNKYKKSKKTPLNFNLPFRLNLPFKLNNLFVKSLFLTTIAVTFVVTISFLSKRKHEVLPVQASFLNYNISKKNRKEIEELLNNEINPLIKNLCITVKFDERKLTLTGAEFDFHYDHEKFFDQAKKNKFEKDEKFVPDINYDKTKLTKALENFKKTSYIEPTSYSFKRNGEILTVSAGIDGKVFDVDKTKDLIISNFAQLSKDEIIDAPCNILTNKNKKIDFNDLKNKIECPVKDAAFVKTPAGKPKIENEQYGIILDNSEKQKIIDPENGTYKLKLKIIKPKITVDSIREKTLKDPDFQTPIASYTTKVAGSTTSNGHFNKQKSAKAINGTVIFPGEEFNFASIIQNEKRAHPNEPYRKAIVYNPHAPNGQEMGEGGGICQVCSTLFGAALQGNLTITERHCHSKRVNYIPIGQDAAYSDGGKNLRFINNRSNPIIIKASANTSNVTVTICGKVLPEETVKVIVNSKETNRTADKIFASACQHVYQNGKEIKTWHFNSIYSIIKDTNKKTKQTTIETPASSAPQEEISQAQQLKPQTSTTQNEQNQNTNTSNNAQKNQSNQTNSSSAQTTNKPAAQPTLNPNVNNSVKTIQQPTNSQNLTQTPPQAQSQPPNVTTKNANTTNKQVNNSNPTTATPTNANNSSTSPI